MSIIYHVGVPLCVWGSQKHVSEVIISINTETRAYMEQLVGHRKGQAVRAEREVFKHSLSQYAHGSVLRPRLPAVQLAYVRAR